MYVSVNVKPLCHSGESCQVKSPRLHCPHWGLTLLPGTVWALKLPGWECGSTCRVRPEGGRAPTTSPSSLKSSLPALGLQLDQIASGLGCLGRGFKDVQRIYIGNQVEHRKNKTSKCIFAINSQLGALAMRVHFRYFVFPMHPPRAVVSALEQSAQGSSSCRSEQQTDR